MDHKEKELKDKIAATQEDLIRWSDSKQKLQQELRLQKEQLCDMEKSKKEMEKQCKDYSSKIFALSQQQSQWSNERNSLSSQSIRQQTELEAVKKDLLKATSRLDEENKELSKLREDLKILQSQHSLKEKSAQNLREEFKLLKEKEQELDKRVQILSADLIRKETALQSCLKLLEGNPYHRGTQAILREQFPGLRGVVGLLLKYSENNAQWVESILGNKLNYLVFDHLSQAQKAVEFLKERRLGRAACFVLEKIPEVPLPDLSHIPNANSLLRFVECPPELTKLKNYLLGSAFLSGSTLYWEGVIDGGSDIFPSNPIEFSAYQNQFLKKEKMQSEVERQKAVLQELEAERSSLKNQILKIANELTETEQVLLKSALQIQHQQNLIQEKEEQFSFTQRELAFYQGELARMEEELKSYSLKSVEVQQKEEELLRELRLAEAQRDELLSQSKEKETEIHQFQLKFAGLEFELKRVSERLEQEENSLSQFKSSLEEWQKRKSELNQVIETSNQKIQQAKETIKRESEKLQEMERKKGALLQEIKELLGRKEQESEVLVGLEKEIVGLRQKQDEISTFMHQIEIDLRTLQSERKNLLLRLKESDSSESIVEISQMERELTPTPADPEELAKLRKKIESMSNSVNLEAPEQYEKLSERYQFLTSQIEDLNRAREDLKNAIRQINATTREQFKETFDKVRENFRKVYATLFEGGEADLILTLPEDLLETGIEIVAQPPGKKLQNISLLSGGEKALTAIALLFAFFLVKPSPVCILDEVDAPWDPANVARFLKLLKEFSKNTQFLIVTHTPRTMEMADILYGVTMEEYGVSKIFSLKLTKEESAPQKDLAATFAN